MDCKSRQSLTSNYSEETLNATTQADRPRECQPHEIAIEQFEHLGDIWPDTEDSSRTLDGVSSAYPRTSYYAIASPAHPRKNHLAGAPAEYPRIIESAGESIVRLYSDQEARVPAFTPKTLSIHMPKIVKPNILIRDTQTGSTLYFAEIAGTSIQKGLILHRGYDSFGPAAARLTVGRGLEYFPLSIENHQNAVSHNPHNLKTPACPDWTGLGMEKKFNSQAMRWSKGNVGKHLTLMDNETNNKLAVYTKDKKKSDGRKGYLEIHDACLATTAEALTIITLCALLEEKRLRGKSRSAAWKMGGAITGIILASVAVFGPVLGPLIGVPVIFAGNFHHRDKYERD